MLIVINSEVSGLKKIKIKESPYHDKLARSRRKVITQADSQEMQETQTFPGADD